MKADLKLDFVVYETNIDVTILNFEMINIIKDFFISMIKMKHNILHFVSCT